MSWCVGEKKSSKIQGVSLENLVQSKVKNGEVLWIFHSVGYYNLSANLSILQNNWVDLNMVSSNMDRVVTFTDFLSQLVHSCIKWTAEKGGNFPTHSILLGKELLQIDNLCRITVVMP